MGGKGGGSKEIRDLKRRISEVIDAVREGSQDRGRAAVAIQGFNALRGALELERKVRELDELEARIEALEQLQEGGSRWPA
jgi:antitoxin (DNA-binding transcriptional repressor) of toxin-antitoxin stability system